MMTLLFALFMVLFSISSVNTSKFEELQKSLHDAFSGAILSGGKSMLNSGSSDTANPKASSVEPPLPSLTPLKSLNETSSKDAAAEAAKAKAEQQSFNNLKRRVDNLAKKAGLSGKVDVTVRRRGLQIQLLTDKLFFASGEATLEPEAKDLVSKIGGIVRDEREPPGRRRGLHRFTTDFERALLVELVAVRRACVGGGRGLRPGRRAGQPDVPAGVRQPATDRKQLHA